MDVKMMMMLSTGDSLSTCSPKRKVGWGEGENKKETNIRRPYRDCIIPYIYARARCSMKREGNLYGRKEFRHGFSFSV